jgi:hypothetical protein
MNGAGIGFAAMSGVLRGTIDPYGAVTPRFLHYTVHNDVWTAYSSAIAAGIVGILEFKLVALLWGEKQTTQLVRIRVGNKTSNQQHNI